MGTINNLSVKETMLMLPGEIYDLWELYIQVNGLKPKKDFD